MKKVAAVLLTITFPIWCFPVFLVFVVWEMVIDLYQEIWDLIS